MGLSSLPLLRLATRLLACAALLLSIATQAQILANSVPLLLPSAIAYDAQGDLYIAETANHIIRKIDPAGRITTVAGTGTQGYDGDGGPATSALLDSPQGLALDATSLYIADTHNHRIRRIDLTSGVISTLTSALDHPVALALDTKGHLFIADAGSHQVRRIDLASGILTTVAGAGTQGFAGDGAQATAALLDSPQGLAVDAAGNLYLADTHNHRIRRIDTTGAITTLAGNGAFGYAGDAAAANSARLALPQGLTLDSLGNLYFADSANHRLRQIDAKTGTITTLAGDGVQGFANSSAAPTAASLDSPRATAISTSGLVTIVDTGNQRVRQIAGDSLQTVAGLGAVTPPGLAISGPASISYGTGDLTASLAAGSDANGTVTFLDSFAGAANIVGTSALSSGISVLDTSSLAAGLHSITASYNGDPSHPAAQSPAFSLLITKAITATTLTIATDPLVTGSSGTSGNNVSAGQPVLLTAHVVSATKGTPTGTVVVSDGGSLLGAGDANATGDYVFSTSALAAGPHSLFAAYAGDANFQPSTSPTALFTVSTPPATGGDFTLAPTGTTTQTILSGSSADFTFAVQMQGSLPSPVTLSATGLPNLATASFNPGSIPPGSGSASFTMTVATPQTSAQITPPHPATSSAILTLLLPLFGYFSRRRSSAPKLLLLLLSCASLLIATGCGDRINRGDSSGSGAPKTKSYAITVTATATDANGAVLRHTAVVNLTLQSE